MGNYTILSMFENPRRGRQARNFTTNAPKILVLKSSSEQIFSRKLPLGAPVILQLLSDVCCHITVIRRLILYVLLYNCYQTSDVWLYMLCYITVIRGLITVIWCQTSTNSSITVILQLLLDVCFHITVIRRLMLYVVLYNCYQTSAVI